MQMALLDSCGSRLDDALDAMACLRHGVPQEHHLAPLHRRTLPRAQPEAGRACWLRDAAVPDFSRPEHKLLFVEAVLVTLL
jgi:hypothetical protein